MQQDMPVKDHKPANIKVYDYYMPGELRCCTAEITEMSHWEKLSEAVFLKLGFLVYDNTIPSMFI